MSVINSNWKLVRAITSALILSLGESMDRLDGPARLMVVSDLDYTMVDHDDPDNHGLLQFNSLWEAFYRHDSLLVFSTGRSPTIYKELRNEKPLLTPDIVVMSVGTEIAYGDSMVPDLYWEQYLNHKWDRKIVAEETSKFSELVLQSETEQRPHKVSFFVDKTKAADVIRILQACLEERKLDFKIIYSGGIALDVLPRRAGKGEALTYLMKKLEAEGKIPVNTLVCGDSGNDAELFTVQGVYGVMVSNAQEELLEWHSQHAKNSQKIVHASERCSLGIIQAIGHFGLGPCVSPRGELASSKHTEEQMHPAPEVAKLYLSCERWLRADIEKSEQFLQNFKSIFHLSGVFVHPSGVEKHIYECLDVLNKSYGCKQDCRIWVDRVSSAQIGSDIWLVKFHKWELSGGERHCCLTTALLNAKGEGFTWMHIHQTWLKPTSVEPASALLF